MLRLGTPDQEWWGSCVSDLVHEFGHFASTSSVGWDSASHASLGVDMCKGIGFCPAVVGIVCLRSDATMARRVRDGSRVYTIRFKNRLLTNASYGFRLIPHLIAEEVDLAENENNHYGDTKYRCFDDIQEAFDQVVDILDLLLFWILLSRRVGAGIT
ncbi:hypothetical protein KCU62_g441, partial [Aureobasidium sp. EXF-3399]